MFLDVETQNGPEDVPGGWSNAAAFKCSCAVTCSEANGEPAYQTWWEEQAPDLLGYLGRHDRIVGFNVKRFDYAVLSAYGDVNGLFDKTTDILDMIYERLGFRISLQSLAETNLGLSKLGTGSEPVQWWRAGDLDRLVQYCQEDVKITRLLFQKILADGFLLYDDKRLGEICRVSLQLPITMI